MPLTTGQGARTRLALFGGPRMWLGSGEEIRLTPSHQRILALTWGHAERGIQRSTAIGLLWGLEDDGRSRHRLRQLLHDLGVRVGFRPISPDGEHVLVPAKDLVSCDLDAFHEALAGGNLRPALAQHAKGFASGLDCRGCGQDFDDWLLSKREGLRRRLRDAAAGQWDRCSRSGPWDQARDAAEVLGAMEPDSEGAVMRLVEARAMTGNLEAALAAASDFVDRLPAGASPSPTSLDLIARIRRMQPLQVATSPHTPPPPPLVGRRRGLATARGMLGRVGEGSFEFLLLTGEGGAGKTRIMEEIWKEATLAGFRCLEARPAEVERRLPLSPLIDMLQDPSTAKYIRAMEEPWRSVVASLLPKLPEGMDPPVVPPIAESSLSRRLFDAFARLLSAIAEAEPLVLFIDDLQWADATTVSVLQFVQRRWRSGSLGIVATMRTDLVSGNDGARKYLVETADLPVTAVELGDLTESEARTLVDLVAGKELDSVTATRLCALGGRNPFYLIELARDYLAGKVTLPELPTDAITLPISLRQLLEPRIQGLGEEAASTGSYLAVWGRFITLADLSGLTRRSLAETADLVEELERSRLATVDRGRVRLSHELFRSAIYHGLTATRRSLLHAEVAEFLEGVEAPQAGELAIHYDRAGNAAGAASKGRQAADRALESGAMAEAAYFLQLVLENETDATRKADATADLGRVLHMNREILRANPLLELAASRLRAVGNHARALRMDIRRVEGLAEVGAAPLSDLLDRLSTIKATARADGDDEALALALDSQLHLLHRGGEVRAIRALFNEVRVVAGSANPAASCLANASLALNVLFGDADEALRCAREAVRVAEGGNVRSHLLLTYSRLSLVLIYQGLLGRDEGLNLVAKATSFATSSGDLTLKAYLALNQGVFSMEVGRNARAHHFFQQTAQILERSEPGLPHVALLYNRGELLIQEREYADALLAFRDAEAVSGSSTPEYLRALICAGIGLCSLELGHLSEARSRAQNIRLASDTEWYYDPTIILDFLARIVGRRGRHGEALGEALGEIEAAANAVRDRLPIAWLKLIQLSARVRDRHRMPPNPDLAAAVALAEELGMSQRASALQRFQDSTGRRSKKRTRP